MEFYLTLPSDGSPLEYATNVPAKFRNKLPYSIELDGTWMCALVEISYPNSWNNVRKEDNRFAVAKDETAKKNGTFISMEINPGQYDSIGDILGALNTKLQRLGAAKDNILFTYNRITRKVSVKIQNAACIELLPGLANILGFGDEKTLTTTTTARFPVNLSGGVTALYVHTNIISSQIFGNVSVPLLRIVNVDGNYGQDGNQITRIYSNPHYVEVNQRHFENIEIVICDDKGEPVVFESGKCIVKLHFRRAFSKFF